MGTFNFSTRPERIARTFESLIVSMMRGQGKRDAFLKHLGIAAKDDPLRELLTKAGQLVPTAWADLADPREPDFYENVQKAAVAAATTTDATWASPLVALGSLVNGFLESLRFTSLLDDLAVDMRPWQPGTKFAISSATAAGASSLDAVWKSVGKPEWDLDTVVPSKAHALVVVTNQLLFSALAGNAIASELRRAVSVASDAVVVPILTHGLSSIPCSGDARSDFAAALDAMDLSADSRLHCYMPSKTLKQLCLRGEGHDGPATFPDLTFSGGSISGMGILPVDALADQNDTATLGDAILIVDANQVVGFAGSLIPDVTTEADIWMDDTAGGKAGQSMVSLFQTSSTGLRLERWFSVNRPRAKSVSVISNAHYSSGSP
jgi:hypothetical protein